MKIEIISIYHNSSIDIIHCRVSPLSYTRSTKTISLKLSAYSFAWFLYLTKRISDWHHFCKWKILQLILQVEVSVGTMQLTLSMAIIQVTTSVAIMQVTVSVAIMQLSFCGTYGGVSFCSKYVGDNFCCNYADGSFCCSYAGEIFCKALCIWLFLL